MLDQANSRFQQRRRLRLPGYDYSQSGAYFITICTNQRNNLFGTINITTMAVNIAGKIVGDIWKKLPIKFPSIIVDAFIVMPNHFHGIIIVGAQFIAPSEGVINHAPTLGKIVRTFKAQSARTIRQQYNSGFSWQRNYYEHVIRDESSLNRIREYIHTNPTRWHLDRENSKAIGKDDFDEWLVTFTGAPGKL